MRKIEKLILEKLQKEKIAGIDEEKYQSVMAYMDNEILRREICKYICTSAINKYFEKEGNINLMQVLNIIDFNFCFAEALNYIAFLQNDHEYVEFETSKAR